MPAEPPGPAGMSDVGPRVEIRRAVVGDLGAIVALLAEDKVGGHGDTVTTPLSPRYHEAFAAISRQDHNEILVAVEGDRVVGCYQLMILPGLTRGGITRAQVEMVLVAHDRRGGGIGTVMMNDAIARARAAGCGVVQLTSNRRRVDAHRFYQRLGFEMSHVGFKYVIE